MKKKKKWIIISIIAAVLVFLYIPGGYIAALFVFHSFYDRRLSTPDTVNTREEFKTYCYRKDYAFPEEEKIPFTSGDHQLMLHYYDNPSSKGAFLTAHGHTSLAGGRESTYEYDLYQKGYDIYALDLTASGESEGESIAGMQQGIYDVKAALDVVLEREDSIYLSGYSWGAYSTLGASNYSEKIKGVIAFAGFTTSNRLMKWGVERYIGGIVNLFSWEMESCSRLKYGKDSDLNVCDVIDSTNIKYLLIQGDGDFTIGSTYNSVTYHYLENPNDRVETLVLEGKNHGNVFYSDAAREYKDSLKEGDEIDRARASEFDTNISDMFEKFLS